MSYPMNHLQGDLMVDNDLFVGGRHQVAQNARFKRDVFIEGTLYCRQLKNADQPPEDTQTTLETEISVANKNSKNPATTEAIYNAIDSVQGDVDVNTQDIDTLTERITTLEQNAASAPTPTSPPSEGPGEVPEDDDETLYPEYYGPVADGIDYYDWPLRCYNGEVELQASQIETGVYPQKVFAPSERIAYRFADMPGFISTDQVYYNTVTRQFVLGVDDGGVTKYYARWGGEFGWNRSWGDDFAMWAQYCGSSAEWNDEGDVSVSGVVRRAGTGRARTDCIYSDISPRDDGSGKLRRVTSVVRNGQLVDIVTTMTSDEEALYACIRATKGNMRLHSGKIYFVNRTQTYDSAANSPLSGLSDFVLDGQGGVVFCWGAATVAYNGQTGGSSNGSLFPMFNCERGVVRRLKLRTLRDRDNGAPSGHRRFSSSCGRRTAFGVFGSQSKGTYCRNLRFEDISFKGFYQDFDIRGNGVRDIEITGYTSREMCQNFISGAKNVLIRDVDVMQNGFCAGGLHVIYGSSGLTGITVQDGVIATSAPWVGVMLTYHGSVTAQDEEIDDTTGDVTVVSTNVKPADIHYHNLRLYASRIAQGGSGTNRPQWQHFHDCLLVQTWDGKILTDASWDRNINGMIIGSAVNYDFDNCRFVLAGSRLMTYNNETWTQLLMRNCGIYSHDVYGDNAQMTLVAGFRGTLLADSVTVDWAGQTGVDFTRGTREARRELQEASAEALELSRRHDAVLYDADVSGAGRGPEAELYMRDPEEGETYLATDTDKLFTCATAGVKGAWLIYGKADNFTAGDFHGTVTMRFSEVETETVRVDATGVETLTDLYHAIGAAFAAAGHRVAYPGDTNPGHYGVLVYEKWPYPMPSGVRSVSRSWENTSTGAASLLLGSGALWQYVTGIAPVWEETEAEGVVTRLERLQERVAVAASGEAELPENLHVGYTYFDETAGKPLWLHSIAQDGTYNWVDATGTPYLGSGSGQAGL